MLESVDVAKGIKDGGAVVVNSSRSPEEVRNEIRDFDGKVYTIDAKGDIVQDTNGWIYWDGTFSPYSDWVTHTYTYDSKGNLTVNKYMSPSSYFGIYTNVTKYEYYGNGELLAYDGNWRYGYNKADGSRVWEYGGGYRCDVFMEMVYTPDA